MRRRNFLKTLTAAPAGAALAQQQPRSIVRQATEAEQLLPPIEGVLPDAAAATVPRFFTREQFATLRKLSAVLLPPLNGNPGALDAGAPEFLDFQVGISVPERQKFYRAGLEDLNGQAQTKFRRPFAELDAAEAEAILKPMFQPRGENRSVVTPGPFINVVHQDIRMATMNSPDWARAADAAQRRNGAGYYWRAIDPTVLR